MHAARFADAVVPQWLRRVERTAVGAEPEEAAGDVLVLRDAVAEGFDGLVIVDVERGCFSGHCWVDEWMVRRCWLCCVVVG